MKTSALRITVLVENTAGAPDLRGEHGLAYWIEAGASRLLFDTGQTPEVLRYNADRLNIDLGAAQAVVLSHGHYDHTGGLRAALDLAPGLRVFAHPGVARRRFSRRAGGVIADVGMARAWDQATLERDASPVWTSGPTEVAPGLYATGEIPRKNPHEDVGGAFFLDQACTQPDPIVDDQALYADTPEGAVVILGCAHAGVVNTLSHVRSLTGDRPIVGVIGGMHLLHASPQRMAFTLASLRELEVKVLAPAHCTGDRATAQLQAAMPDAWRPCLAGSQFSFSLTIN